MHRIQPAHQQEQRQHHEELDHVAAKHHGHILTESTHDDARRDLRRQLPREGEDAHRQDEEEGTDQGKQQLLRPIQHAHQRLPVLRLRHEGQCEAHGRRHQHHGQHVARRERLHEVIRDDREEMIVIRQRAKLLYRHIAHARTHDIRGQVARRDPQEEEEPDTRRRKRRQ